MATGTILLPIPAHSADPTNPPGFGVTAANRPYLLFDDTTDELVIWAFRLPENYASGITIKVQYSMASDITNVIRIRTEWQAVAETEDIDTDSWSTVEASADDTVPATTAGNMGELSEAMTTPTLAAGDYVALRFGRENATSGTNATGDMEVWAVSLEYTTT